MINPFPHEDHDLAAAIDSAHADLANHKADSDEYAKALDQLSKLYKIRNANLQSYQDAQQFELNLSIEQEKLGLAEKEAERPFWTRMSPDTILSVAGNLAIAIIVTKYEREGVISTQLRHFMRNI